MDNLDDNIHRLIFGYVMGNDSHRIFKLNGKLKLVNKQFKRNFFEYARATPLKLNLLLLEQDQDRIDELGIVCNCIYECGGSVEILNSSFGFDEKRCFMTMLQNIDLVQLKTLSLSIIQNNNSISTDDVYSLFTSSHGLIDLDLTDNTPESHFEMMFKNHECLENVTLSCFKCIPQPAITKIQKLPKLSLLRLPGYNMGEMSISSASLTILNLGNFFLPHFGTLRINCPSLQIFIADAKDFAGIPSLTMRLQEVNDVQIKKCIGTEIKWLDEKEDCYELYTKRPHVDISWANVRDNCIFVMLL